MEKISNIVRGNARVASTDLKSASAVRPGAPAFGRPVGESPSSADRGETTAMRANAIQNELTENKRANSQDRVVQNMSDNFFMTRIRGGAPEVEAGKATMPAKEVEMRAPRENEVEGEEKAIAAPAKADASSTTDELVLGDMRSNEVTQPIGYTPRGSFVNVHA